MKKKIIILIALTVFSTAMLSARGVGINLDIGGQYCNHELHTIGSTSSNGTYTHAILGQHLGGFNIGLEYSINKNWAFLAETIFSIKNNGFVNDSLIGFGYNFRLSKGFNAFFGGGFAFGGNVNVGSPTIEYAYVGGGLKGEVSYMFSSMFGAYAGGTLNLYGIPTLTTRYSSGNTTKTNPTQDMAKSLNLKLGMRIRL